METDSDCAFYVLLGNNNKKYVNDYSFYLNDCKSICFILNVSL